MAVFAKAPHSPSSASCRWSSWSTGSRSNAAPRPRARRHPRWRGSRPVTHDTNGLRTDIRRIPTAPSLDINAITGGSGAPTAAHDALDNCTRAPDNEGHMRW